MKKEQGKSLSLWDAKLNYINSSTWDRTSATHPGLWLLCFWCLRSVCGSSAWLPKKMSSWKHNGWHNMLSHGMMSSIAPCEVRVQHTCSWQVASPVLPGLARVFYLNHWETLQCWAPAERGKHSPFLVSMTTVPYRDIKFWDSEASFKANALGMFPLVLLKPTFVTTTSSNCIIPKYGYTIVVKNSWTLTGWFLKALYKVVFFIPRISFMYFQPGPMTPCCGLWFQNPLPSPASQQDLAAFWAALTCFLNESMIISLHLMSLCLVGLKDRWIPRFSNRFLSDIFIWMSLDLQPRIRLSSCLLYLHSQTMANASPRLALLPSSLLLVRGCWLPLSL